MEGLIDRLGRVVYLDTNVVIYIIEGYARYETVLRTLLAAMDTRDIMAVTSELTVAEVLVKPLRDGNRRVQHAYQAFLQPSAALRLVPIDRPLLENAAALRAARSVKLPDAIHLATAGAHQCDAYLTNDEGLRSVTSVPVRLLAELL
ncbi:MAG: PIN domain-containing protein [Chloroflexi bacterium]|nr:PIN domain-containing protein [Chloroflexota bacterium]